MVQNIINLYISSPEQISTCIGFLLNIWVVFLADFNYSSNVNPCFYVICLCLSISRMFVLSKLHNYENWWSKIIWL